LTFKERYLSKRDANIAIFLFLQNIWGEIIFESGFKTVFIGDWTENNRDEAVSKVGSLFHFIPLMLRTKVF